MTMTTDSGTENEEDRRNSKATRQEQQCTTRIRRTAKCDEREPLRGANERAKCIPRLPLPYRTSRKRSPCSGILNTSMSRRRPPTRAPRTHARIVLLAVDREQNRCARAPKSRTSAVDAPSLPRRLVARRSRHHHLALDHSVTRRAASSAAADMSIADVPRLHRVLIKVRAVEARARSLFLPRRKEQPNAARALIHCRIFHSIAPHADFSTASRTTHRATRKCCAVARVAIAHCRAYGNPRAIAVDLPRTH
jgi:hypothetical protein